MMNIFEKKGESVSREGGSAGASGRAAEFEHARELEENRKAGQVMALQAGIRELDENIQAIAASIEDLVTKIREGKRIAGEKGSEKLSALNARLEEEAQKEKIRLLGEREKLEAERQTLETKLSDL
jgi:hypothetical protein